MAPEKAVAVSCAQTGETADTLAAMREAKEKGASLWTICNVVGSMATSLADGTIHTHAGPAIGPAPQGDFDGLVLPALLVHLTHMGGLPHMGDFHIWGRHALYIPAP